MPSSREAVDQVYCTFELCELRAMYFGYIFGKSFLKYSKIKFVNFRDNLIMGFSTCIVIVFVLGTSKKV